MVYPYVGWRCEHQAIEHLSADCNFSFSTTRIGPKWTENLLRSHAYWLDRVSSCNCYDCPSSCNLEQLGSFEYLTELSIDIRKLSDSSAYLVRDKISAPDQSAGSSGGALSVLARLKKLKSLRIDGRADDASFSAVDFSFLDALQDVTIVDAPITDASVRRITAAPNLQDLRVECVSIGDGALIGIGRAKNLSGLNLEGSWQVTGRTLDQLAPLVKLEWLSLNQTQLDENTLARLPSLPHLEQLDIEVSQISSKAILTLSDQPAMKCVSIASTNDVESQAVALKRRFPAVKVRIVDDLGHEQWR